MAQITRVVIWLSAILIVSAIVLWLIITLGLSHFRATLNICPPPTPGVTLCQP